MSLLTNAEADLADYRQGQRLTMAVVVVTAVLLLWPQVWKAATGQRPETASLVTISGDHPDKETGQKVSQWMDLIISCAIILLVCRAAWRGGATSSGCLTIFYGGALATFVLASVLTVAFFAWRTPEGTGFKFADLNLQGVGHELGSTLAFIIFGGWTAFAFWVLTVSKDARFYRDARRQGIRLDGAAAGQSPVRR